MADKKNGQDDLFIFGYSCKLFRNDTKALELDRGKNLCPWMGDENLLIDRFDARGYLHDIAPFEAPAVGAPEIKRTEEEAKIEKLCDEERFADLAPEVIDPNYDEEMQKLRTALACEGAYSQVAFTYDSLNSDVQRSDQVALGDNDGENCPEVSFKAPAGLSIPNSLQVPATMKEHNLIEKTAVFIAQNGPQMEIIIKAKQSSNPNFTFLSFESHLNPYYRFLLSSIKTGEFVPVPVADEANIQDNSSDSESDDGNYLHPSLLVNKKQPVSLPAMPIVERKVDVNSSYSQLVQNFKEKIVQEPADESSAGANSSSIVLTTEKKTLATVLLTPFDSNGEKKESKWSLLPPPSPEMEQIIDKLAQYVAKSGDSFEVSIKKRKEERFEFLNPGHIYHAYYIKRKLHYLEEQRKLKTATSAAIGWEPEDRKVSFSLKDKKAKKDERRRGDDKDLDDLVESSRSVDNESVSKSNAENALANKLAAAAKDSMSKEKKLQEERKRRAALFLSLIKSKESKNGESTAANGEPVYGPSLPVITMPPNAKSSASLRNPSPDEDKKVAPQKKLAALLPFTRSDHSYKSSSPEKHTQESRHRSHSSHKKRSRSRSPEKSRSHRRHKSKRSK